MSKRKKNFRNKTKMSRQEKQDFNKVLQERNYNKEDIDIGESIFETIEKAKLGIYDEIFMPNVISLVYQIGCCSKCVIKNIQELREKDVNIHFIEEDIDTRNRRNDLLLGTLIGEAVYQMTLESEVMRNEQK